MVVMSESEERTRGPALVAHRGYALRYPENTIESLTAAVEAGACFVEFDVQLSADGVPVLLHDADLERTAGVPECVMDLQLARLQEIEVNEPARFGETFTGVHVPTLAEAMSFLGERPQVKAFVEIKSESLQRFGRESVVERVMSDLLPRLDQCALISFDMDVLLMAREREAVSIGWVLDGLSPATREAAAAHSPEYLFCDYEMIPVQEKLWPGAWQWALYDVSDPGLALRLAARGAQLIETMAIREMLEHPAFASGVCGDE